MLYDEFIRITKQFNNELFIVPVLYGSLGLEKATGVKVDPQDIDILVPLVFLKEKWNLLRSELEKLGYKLIDRHEHEFMRNEVKVGIAFKEDLKLFAGVDYKNLMIEEYDGARYYILSISDYLNVYSKSLVDGYRRTKNNNKDQGKLDILLQII